jgi:hypothetical protein
MSFKLPSPNDMGTVVRDSLHHYLEWHICEHYGVHRVDDLTVTEIQEVMAEYFNQKSARIDSMVAEALRVAIGNWEASNGKGIL